MKKISNFIFELPKTELFTYNSCNKEKYLMLPNIFSVNSFCFLLTSHLLFSFFLSTFFLSSYNTTFPFLSNHPTPFLFLSLLYPLSFLPPNFLYPPTILFFFYPISFSSKHMHALNTYSLIGLS